MAQNMIWPCRSGHAGRHSHSHSAGLQDCGECESATSQNEFIGLGQADRSSFCGQICQAGSGAELNEKVEVQLGRLT